jgi:hypothetical protein
MGGFGDAVVVQATAATPYYRSAKGVCFGAGSCPSPTCPSQAQSNKAISDNKGLVSGNPYTFECRCPGCNAEFTPAWMWFYDCAVTLNKTGGAEQFACRGAEMRRIELQPMDHTGTSTYFSTTA